ncbi:ATP-binding protein [Pseudomonas sp. LS-2]|uniref:AAA family ATPase n=1 Tax=Pseudomonas sp. LS-2 TaxID=2315859 RepID=UPI000E709A44|nr:ATP-binding protein [Pseudomonas sp. LS-2]RJX82289.1 AAA family ATPase [Pseudomonas sp. LS-2]
MSSIEGKTDRISTPLKLAFPVVAIETFELARSAQVIESVANDLKKRFMAMPFKQVPDPGFIAKVAGESKEGVRGTVIYDPYFFDRQRLNAETLPSLKASLVALEQHGITYVIAGRDSLAEEFVYHIELPAMDQSEIVEVLKSAERDVERSIGRDEPEPAVFTAAERIVIANHAMGLSHTQMRNVFILSAYRKHKGLDYLSEVRREKGHILRDVGLDVLEPIDISTVGGLEPLKKFLSVRKVGWDQDLPLKGVLLAGVPGGGKTLMAKAAAFVFGTTLVRLDMNQFYSKYQGETEAKFRRALQTIDQIAPVTVLMDELDKAFAQGEGDNEVSRRLLGAFLYWLQERKNKVFLVASANRVGALPPELMRAGRWDRSFFIDLPSKDERKAIFEIHLSKAGVERSTVQMDDLLVASEGYTGAEIEQAVVDARYLALSQDVAVSQEILVTALGDISPASKTRKADIDEIRRLGEQGFYRANTQDVAELARSGRQLAVD